MVKSMTGFGRGSVATPTHVVTVELSTVNRKQFDATVWLPREWMCFEVPLLSLLKGGILRGAVKCAVNVKPLGGGGASDELSARFAMVSAAAVRMGITVAPTLSDLVTLSTATELSALPEPSEEMWAAVEAAAREALEKLCAMRLHEGERIVADLRERFARLFAMYESIRAEAPGLPAAQRDVLRARIEALLPEGITLDEGALEREVALFADRCDISEELTRLDAHFAHAETLLGGEAPCGRPLDFLCQEFFREINTTGSKCASNHISHLVIEFKTLLETVREQVQNLE